MKYSRCCRSIRNVSLFLFIANACAIAQTPRTLTLQDAIGIADQQSVDIRIAQAALLRANYAVAQTRTAYLPELSANANYFYNIQRQVLFVAPDVPFNETGSTQAFPIGSRVQTGASLNLIQPLYQPLPGSQRAAAEADVQVATVQLEVARRLVRRNAERAFYRAIYARMEKEAREAQILEALRNLDVAIARLKQGRAMPLDTLTASTSVARVQAQAARARYEYSATKLSLAHILDISDYENIEVLGALDLPLPPGPSGGEMIEPTGRVNSPQAQALEAERIAAQSRVDLVETSMSPTINAVASVTAGGQSATLKPDDYRWAMTSQVGLTAYFPIFNLWRNNPKRDEAMMRVREAELEIERLRKQDSVEVEGIMLSLNGARAQLRAEETTLTQAQKALDIARILYKEGRATQLDVESAQSRLLDAQLSVEQVKLQFLESYADLKALLADVK